MDSRVRGQVVKLSGENGLNEKRLGDEGLGEIGLGWTALMMSGWRVFGWIEMGKTGVSFAIAISLHRIVCRIQAEQNPDQTPPKDADFAAACAKNGEVLPLAHGPPKGAQR